MAKQTEGTIYNTITNLDVVNSTISVWGVAYNPSNPLLKLAALQTVASNAHAAHTATASAKANLQAAASARQHAFEGIQKYATKINAAFAATATTQQLKDNATFLVKKIRGERISAKKTEEEIAALAEKGIIVKEISSSQRGYQNVSDHFEKLVKILTSSPLYAPNETELKLATIVNYLADIKSKNLAVMAALSSYDVARTNRDLIIYQKDTGIIDLTVAVKSYAKSLFGSTSQQYKMVSKVRFSRRKKL